MSFAKNSTKADPSEEYLESELAAVRKAFRLRPDVDAGPWVEHMRDLSRWRYRVAEWLIVFVVSPAEYLRRTMANRARVQPDADTADWRRAWQEAYAEARQQVLDLAAPGQLPLALAWEILERGNREVLYGLAYAGWLPRMPSMAAPQPRRPMVSDAQRQADAERLAGEL